MPVAFYDQIMLGQDGREEQLQHMINTVRNMGKAGIPILGYHWMPNSVWRTPGTTTLRGGDARSARFTLAEHDPEELTHGRVFARGNVGKLLLVFRAPAARCRRGQRPPVLHPDDPPTGVRWAASRASTAALTISSAIWTPLTAPITASTSAWAAGRRWGATTTSFAPSSTLADAIRSFTSTFATLSARLKTFTKLL